MWKGLLLPPQWGTWCPPPILPASNLHNKSRRFLEVCSSNSLTGKINCRDRQESGRMEGQRLAPFQRQPSLPWAINLPQPSGKEKPDAPSTATFCPCPKGPLLLLPVDKKR